MISELAKQDLKALRDGGYSPTDEEVISLNELAVQIECGKNQTCLNSPRIAFCGQSGIVLHEPTIGGMLWWFEVGRDASDDPKFQMMTHFYMLANCRRLDVLNSVQTKKEVVDSVKKWMKTIDATEAELWRAMLYVKRYDELAEDIKPDSHKWEDDELDRLWAKLIRVSSITGITPKDLMCNTDSQLVSLLMESSLHNHIQYKRSVADLYIRYRELIRAIESRGTSSNGSK